LKTINIHGETIDICWQVVEFRFSILTDRIMAGVIIAGHFQRLSIPVSGEPKTRPTPDAPLLLHPVERAPGHGQSVKLFLPALSEAKVRR
jgi:hypothetical protein